MHNSKSVTAIHQQIQMEHLKNSAKKFATNSGLTEASNSPILLSRRLQLNAIVCQPHVSMAMGTLRSHAILVHSHS